MIVTGDEFAADADEGAAGIGSGEAGFVVDSVAVWAVSFVATEVGEVDLVGSAVRFVTFCTDDFCGASGTAGVLPTGRAAIADAGVGGAAVLGDEGVGTAALSRWSSGGCCGDPAASLGVGLCGTATSAITSTAIPDSAPICPRVGCHTGVDGITESVATFEFDSVAGRVSTTGAAEGTAGIVAGGVAESCSA